MNKTWRNKNMNNIEHKKQLVIIAGVAGEIGTEFAKKLVENNIETLGIIRNKSVSEIDSPLFKTVACHLDNPEHVEQVFGQIDLSVFDRVVYLHTIGVDKFDPRGYPHIKTMKTIDEDIYNTNVNTFKYLLKFLGTEIRNIRNSGKNIELKTAIIAGVSDKYTPFVIEGFCEAKFILREYLRLYMERFPSWFSGLSINITSTITKAALAVRPYADTEFWLTPQEVVEKSLNDLISNNQGYQEIDVIKFSPEYQDDYYENNEKLYTKWSKETGIK